MSLLVNNFIRDLNGEMTLIEPPEHWQELAGFESYRNKLYGSVAARTLGLQLLPSLAKTDLYVEGGDVDVLRIEAELALANLESFESEAGTSSENLRPRFQNIIRACEQANDQGGGVVIW